MAHRCKLMPMSWEHWEPEVLMLPYRLLLLLVCCFSSIRRYVHPMKARAHFDPLDGLQFNWLLLFMHAIIRAKSLRNENKVVYALILPLYWSVECKLTAIRNAIEPLPGFLFLDPCWRQWARWNDEEENVNSDISVRVIFSKSHLSGI